MARVIALVLLLTSLAFGRVALPDFAAPEELAPLARALPVALASRLVAAGEEVNLLGVPLGPEEARALLSAGYDEVVLGEVLRLGGALAVTARRYRLEDGEPLLVGTATLTASSPTRLLDEAGKLLAQLYADRPAFAPGTLAHLLVVPGHLRLPLGGRRKLVVYALDEEGRELKGVRPVFQVEDPGVARVDEEGRVVAVAPGETRVWVQAVGVPGAGRVKAEASVTVNPPAFGLRLGGVALGERPPFPGWVRVGLRLSSSGGTPPAYDGGGTDVAEASQSPLDYLASFFAGIVTSGQLTAALDYELGTSLLFHLEAYQRTLAGYFGAGLGFATPTAPEGLQGVSLRLVLGSYLLGTRYPLEAVGEAVFPTADGRPPAIRLALALGLDLYP